MIFSDEYFAKLGSSNQGNQNESAPISLTDTSDSQVQSLDLRPAHKYLGFATAAMAGITAASFSSEDFHKIAGYTTVGLSLLTTGIGFYEYGEYFDLDEGFTGYNLHMILETLAIIGFIATTALQDEDGAHAVMGGVSTAMMVIPIFTIE